MLAAVLLHVIEPPRRIYASDDLLTRLEQPVLVHGVNDCPALAFKYIQDFAIAKPPGVVRLSAAGRIERRAVENNVIAGVSRFHGDHRGGKIKETGISEVQPLGG